MAKVSQIVALLVLVFIAGGLLFYRFSKRLGNTPSPGGTEVASAPLPPRKPTPPIAKSSDPQLQPSKPAPASINSLSESSPPKKMLGRIPKPQLSETLKAAMEANRLSQKGDPDSDLSALELLRAWAAQPAPASLPGSSPPDAPPSSPNPSMDAQADHLFLMVWERIHVRRSLGDLQPIVLGRFFQSPALSVRQKLLHILDEGKAPAAQSALQARLDKDLKIPLSPANLSSHPGLSWVASAAQNGQHARALDLAGKIRWEKEPSRPEDDLLALIQGTLRHFLSAQAGPWDAAQAGSLFARSQTLSQHKTIHATLGPLVLDVAIQTLEKAMAKPVADAEGLVRNWMVASATGGIGGQVKTLWEWGLERLREGPMDGNRFAHLRVWVKTFGEIFQVRDFAYRYWDALPALERPDGRMERPSGEECYRAALAEATEDGQRLATLRKMSDLFIKGRRFEEGQAVLREEQAKMTTPEGRDRLLEVLADFDGKSAEIANASVREGKEDQRRLKEGQLKFFKERLAEAERRKDSEDNLRSLRVKVKEITDSLNFGF